jgi:hypothetical protein
MERGEKEDEVKTEEKSEKVGRRQKGGERVSNNKREGERREGKGSKETEQKAVK